MFAVITVHNWLDQLVCRPNNSRNFKFSGIYASMKSIESFVVAVCCTHMQNTFRNVSKDNYISNSEIIVGNHMWAGDDKL